jgi:hypothetical protein
MVISNQTKERIVAAMLADMQSRGKSQNEYAHYISIMLDIPFDKTAMSMIKNADKRNAIRDRSWLKLGNHFNILHTSQWNTAQTNAWISVQAGLDLCRENGIWQMLCDKAGIGKSYAAMEYAVKHKGNVFYIDCSDCQSKTDFILELARQLGLEHNSTYTRLWRNVTDELLLMDKPLLILDEFGDVAQSVITLMKGLYNKANQGDYIAVGCYFIGADNLHQRMMNGRKYNKQSYAEFWSRFDNQINSLNFDARPENFRAQLQREIEAIVQCNLPDSLADVRATIIEKCLRTGGVRSIRKEIALQVKIKELKNKNTKQ